MTVPDEGFAAFSIGVVRAEITGRHIPVNGFKVIGEAIPGDQGAGALYIRGVCNGLRAIQDAAGTWWNLALPAGTSRAGWFGAKTGTDEDQAAAIQNAIDASAVVYLDAGIYRIISQISLAGGGKALIGKGRGITVLMSGNPTGNVISLKTGSNRLMVMSMTIDGDVIKTSGAGVSSVGVVSNCILRDLQVRNQYDGMDLRGTDTSLVDNCINERNFSNGIALRNADVFGGGGCQWTIRSTLCQLNDGSGIDIRSTPCAAVPQITLGAFVDVNLFANSGYGIVALGLPGLPIFGFRTNGIFSGENGLGSLYLDTYGNQIEINGAYLEIDGLANTGRLYNTPPTLTANAIVFTPSVKRARISNTLVKAPARTGIVNNCSEKLELNGVDIEDCGSGGGWSAPGIYHQTPTGRLFMTGGSSQNSGAGASQNYGIYAENLSLIWATNADLGGNTVGAYAGPVGAPNLSNVRT